MTRRRKDAGTRGVPTDKSGGFKQGRIFFVSTTRIRFLETGCFGALVL
ncbi:MAG: hypothetical protein NHB32_23890 [Fischerella sp. CENA71]|nr:hypothetical protein [Fischerella sp. CENA71]